MILNYPSYPQARPMPAGLLVNTPLIKFTWSNVFQVDLNVIVYLPILVSGGLVAVKLYYPRSSPGLIVAEFLLLPFKKPTPIPRAGLIFS